MPNLYLLEQPPGTRPTQGREWQLQGETPSPGEKYGSKAENLQQTPYEYLIPIRQMPIVSAETVEKPGTTRYVWHPGKIPAGRCSVRPQRRRYAGCEVRHQSTRRALMIGRLAFPWVISPDSSAS
jgi:hypothetical protein